jgi:hypothetical protein
MACSISTISDLTNGAIACVAGSFEPDVVVNQDWAAFGEDHAECEYSLVGELFDLHAVEGRFYDEVDDLFLHAAGERNRQMDPMPR